MKIFKKKISNARKCKFDGFVFDSMLERDRYIWLKQAQKGGMISQLKLQVPFEIITTQNKGKNKVPSICADRLKTIRKTQYFSDFVYLRHSDMQWIINDVKGRTLEVYKLKLKLVIQLYCTGQGFTFIETYKDNKQNNFLDL